MLLRVHVQKTARAPELEARWLRGVLGAAYEVAAPGSVIAELTLRVVGRRAIRRLSVEFMGEDHVTDVLSFPSGSADPYLGDIALCWPVAVEQAAEHGHPAAVEAALLSVHGLLHLLGWDHAELAEQAAMWELTYACLAAAGVQGVAAGRLADV